MNMFHNFDDWAEKHHYRFLDFIRIILGCTILLKGIYFISHTDELQHILASSKFPWLSFAIAHYVAMAHIAGGILIAIGLFTRLSIAFQIPILSGAVVFVNAQKGFFSDNPDLAFSLIVLSLLVFYFFYGSGSLSVDYSWREEESAHNHI